MQSKDGSCVEEFVVSQPMSQPQNQSVSKKHFSATSAGLILITILSLIFAGYMAVNPPLATLTQQQLITNTQSYYNTNTQTVTSIATKTVTNMPTQITSVTSTTLGASTSSVYGSSNSNQSYQVYKMWPGPGYGYYCSPSSPNWSDYYCFTSGPVYYFNGNPTPSCRSISNDTMLTCSGYLYQPDAGCIELAIPVDNAYNAESRIYLYYNLRNLPSSYIASYHSWAWVTVTGRMVQNYNSAPLGGGCSGNYITVSSITP